MNYYCFHFQTTLPELKSIPRVVNMENHLFLNGSILQAYVHALHTLIHSCMTRSSVRGEEHHLRAQARSQSHY